MIKLRRKQSEEAKKNENPKDCVNLIGCTSDRYASTYSLEKLKINGVVQGIVKSGSTNETLEHFVNGMWLHEWLGTSHSRRIFLTLETENQTIHTFDKKGEALRSISLKNVYRLVLKVNKDADHCK